VYIKKRFCIFTSSFSKYNYVKFKKILQTFCEKNDIINQNRKEIVKKLHRKFVDRLKEFRNELIKKFERNFDCVNAIVGKVKKKNYNSVFVIDKHFLPKTNETNKINLIEEKFNSNKIIKPIKSQNQQSLLQSNPHEKDQSSLKLKGFSNNNFLTINSTQDSKIQISLPNEKKHIETDAIVISTKSNVLDLKMKKLKTLSMYENLLLSYMKKDCCNSEIMCRINNNLTVESEALTNSNNIIDCLSPISFNQCFNTIYNDDKYLISNNTVSIKDNHFLINNCYLKKKILKNCNSFKDNLIKHNFEKIANYNRNRSNIQNKERNMMSSRAKEKFKHLRLKSDCLDFGAIKKKFVIKYVKKNE